MDDNNFTYKIGTVLATVIAVCLMVAAVGVTVKFIFWLF